MRNRAKNRVKSAHHEGIELVAVGIAEVGRIELRAALAGRTIAGGAERQRQLVNAVDLLFILGAESGHHAVACCHLLAIERQTDAETGALAFPAPGNQAIVGHEAAHPELAADLVVEFAGLLQVLGADGHITDHRFSPSWVSARVLQQDDDTCKVVSRRWDGGCSTYLQFLRVSGSGLIVRIRRGWWTCAVEISWRARWRCRCWPRRAQRALSPAR